MDLGEIRQQINRIDEQMRDLFLKRMKCAAQVAEAKRQTGGSVYVPKREREILKLRQQGVEKELAAECRTFFKQMIGVSRTYQYSKLLDGQEKLSGIPKGNGEVTLAFFCGKESELPASVLNAAALAGLLIEEMSINNCRAENSSTGQELEDRLYCRLRLSGNFADVLARAAVWQILEETEEAKLLLV